MKFSQLFLSAFLLAKSAIADDSTTSQITLVIPLTENSELYMETITEYYTGQPTTLPTSGTATTTYVVANSETTYTNVLTVTYGIDIETTTHLTLTADTGEYTKTLTTFIINPSATVDSSSESSSATDSSTTASSSSSKGSAAALEAGVGALFVGAALFLL